METKYDQNPTKNDKELVRFHRELLKKFMNIETNLNPKKKRLVIKIYNDEINENNIRFYFNAKLRLFIVALVLNRLDEIKNYYKKD